MIDDKLAGALAEIEAKRAETCALKVKLPVGHHVRDFLHGQAIGLEWAEGIIRRHFGDPSPADPGDVSAAGGGDGSEI